MVNDFTLRAGAVRLPDASVGLAYLRALAQTVQGMALDQNLAGDAVDEAALEEEGEFNWRTYVRREFYASR